MQLLPEDPKYPAVPDTVVIVNSEKLPVDVASQWKQIVHLEAPYFIEKDRNGGIHMGQYTVDESRPINWPKFVRMPSLEWCLVSWEVTMALRFPRVIFGMN